MTITQQVETILQQVPKARDSDQYLTLMVWNTYYPSLIFDTENGKAILLKDIMEVPREDTIKRIRADFQNVQGKYLPSLQVAIARKIKEHFIKATYPNFTGQL